METISFDGFILVTESEAVSGLPLWCGYLQKAANLNFDTNVILFCHSACEFPSQLSSNKRVTIREYFEDFDFLKLRQFLASSLGRTERSVLFLDSITFILQRLGVEVTAALIMSLLAEKRYSSVIGLLNEDVTAPLEIRQLNMLTTSALHLSTTNSTKSAGLSLKLMCRTVRRKADGLTSEKFEEYEIGTNFDIKSWMAKRRDEPTVMELVEEKQSQANSTASKIDDVFERLPFDIGLKLKESEKQAKSNAQLPYTSAQFEKGLVGMNISSGKRIRAGGQIVYTPDAEDDLDDSDPDDDLMI